MKHRAPHWIDFFVAGGVVLAIAISLFQDAFAQSPVLLPSLDIPGGDHMSMTVEEARAIVEQHEAEQRAAALDKMGMGDMWAAIGQCYAQNRSAKAQGALKFTSITKLDHSCDGMAKAAFSIMCASQSNPVLVKECGEVFRRDTTSTQAWASVARSVVLGYFGLEAVNAAVGVATTAISANAGVAETAIQNPITNTVTTETIIESTPFGVEGVQ